MSTESSVYVEAVCRFLQAEGWETDPPQPHEELVFITATQQPTEGDRSIVVLVLTAAATPLRPDHLAQLRAVVQDQAADGAVVTAETGLREAVHERAMPYDRIRALDPATVYSNVDGISPPTTGGSVTRRQLLAGGLLAGGGLLSAGYYVQSRPAETKAAEPEPQSVPYEELRTNTDQYLDSRVRFSPTRIAQVIDSDTETQLFRIQVTYTGTGWKDNVLGRWDGEPYGENYFLEFTGRVVGTISYETVFGTERTIPDIVIQESTEI